MGQVGLNEGLYQFALHALAILLALALHAPGTGRRPRWAWLWLPLATFAASFAAHILAFGVLKSLLGDGIDPWVHRPIVAVIWGAASGLVFYLYARPQAHSAALAAVLTAVSYLAFVMTRQLIG